MKKLNVDEIGLSCINILKVKQSELKHLFRCNLSYEDDKKARRLEVAILKSVDTIRRSMLEDEIMS